MRLSSVMAMATSAATRAAFCCAESASTTDDIWSATVWGRNLTDEYQLANSRKTTDGIVGYTGMPATYGVTFSYNWF